MSERERVEPSGEIQICPYWQRFTIHGDEVLALCGTNSSNEAPLPDTDLGPRLPKCRFNNDLGCTLPLAQIAYIHKSLFREDPLFLTMVMADQPGPAGTKQLELTWPRYVEDFHQAMNDLH